MNSKRQPLFKLALGLFLGISVAALVVTANDQASESEETDTDYIGQSLKTRPAKLAKSALRSSQPEAQYDQEHEEDQQQGGHDGNHYEKNPAHQVSEYTKLLLNPVALIKKISHEFNLPKNKLIEKIGKGLVFGAEAFLSPVVACIKIIEKVFVPDACRLKFACQFGSRLDFMKETMLRFSPNLLEGSSHLRAISHGIIGRDCAATYADCEPTLQDSFKELKEPNQENRQQFYQ